jgi:hypothetical protein
MAGFNDPMTLALLAAGGSMMDPDGGMGEGVRSGINAYAMGKQMQRQGTQDQLAQMQLMKKLEAEQLLKGVLSEQSQSPEGMHPTNIGQALIKTGHPELVNQGIGILKDFRNKVKSTHQVMKDGKLHTQPIYESGEFGQLSELNTPEKLMSVNQGNQINLVGQYTGTPQQKFSVGMTPGESARLSQDRQQFGQTHDLALKNYLLNQEKFGLEHDIPYQAQREAAIVGSREKAKNQVEANSNFPKVVDQANESIKIIDDLLHHPGYDRMVGKDNPIGEIAAFVPGSDARDFKARFEQIKGKQFLEAFETLKGGGAITEIEGQKATQAISRMERAQSEREFDAAAREFQGVIRKGVERAANKVGMPTDGLVNLPRLTPREQKRDSEQKRSAIGSGGFSARVID